MPSRGNRPAPRAPVYTIWVSVASSGQRTHHEAVGGQGPAGRLWPAGSLGSAAGVAGRLSPADDERQYGSLAWRVGLGAEAWHGHCVDTVGVHGQEQAAVGADGTPAELPLFSQLGQVLLHLWRE